MPTKNQGSASQLPLSSRPDTDKQLERAGLELGVVESHNFRGEADLGEHTKPERPREFPLHVSIVDHPGSATTITKQIRVVDDRRGVRRVGIPSPFEMPERTAVAIVASVINPVTIRLAYVIWREQSGTTQTTVDRHRFQRATHITRGTYVTESIVNKDPVELRPSRTSRISPGRCSHSGLSPSLTCRIPSEGSTRVR